MHKSTLCDHRRSQSLGMVQNAVDALEVPLVTLVEFILSTLTFCVTANTNPSHDVAQ